MTTLNIILSTVAVLMLVEGLITAIWPKQLGNKLKHIFKNPKNTVKIGLIEIIISLIILFIIAL